MLTKRVKDLEKEKDVYMIIYKYVQDISTELQSNAVNKYEEGFKEGYNQFKSDMEKLQV